MNVARRFTMGCGLILLLGCAVPALGSTTLSYDFDTGDHGFTAGFADYPVGEDGFYELGSSWGAGPVAGSPNALYIKGNNHSDDLFMYYAKPVSGLIASMTYTVIMYINFYAYYPEDAVGVGGAPGAAVYLKAGAMGVAPDRTVDGLGHWQMTIDKGDQSTSGQDAIVLGHTAHAKSDFQWHLVERQGGGESFTATADASGNMWLLFGTDSGFEGFTELYYTSATYALTAVPEPASLALLTAGAIAMLRRRRHR